LKVNEREENVTSLHKLLAGLEAGKGVSKEEVCLLSKELQEVLWLLRGTRDENGILVNKLKIGEENYEILRSTSRKEIRELKGNFAVVLKENDQLRKDKRGSFRLQDNIKKLQGEIKILKRNKNRTKG